jgi:hypothetical protein
MKEYFKTPTADELATRELEEAKRELLRALSGQDYANRIVQYHQDRIKRLTEYLNVV